MAKCRRPFLFIALKIYPLINNCVQIPQLFVGLDHDYVVAFPYCGFVVHKSCLFALNPLTGKCWKYHPIPRGHLGHAMKYNRVHY